MSNENAKRIIEFWQNAGSQAWFKKDDAFDEEIRREFGQLIHDAGSGKLEDWISEANSCLAYILLLDQFTRNIFRQSPSAFAYDGNALNAAKIAIAKNHIKKIDDDLQAFVIMPFMHSEDIDDQKHCIELMKQYSNEGSVKFAIIHHDIIEKFGRFPHRNEVLGRVSTDAELEFLAGDGFKG